MTEIGIPDVPGGDFFAPFMVETVNGAPQIALRPDAIPDASISTRMLTEGVFSKISYANFSDVTKTATQWNNGGAGDIVAAATCSLNEGSALLIDFITLFKCSAIPLNNGGFVKLLVNGNVVKNISVPPALTTTQVGALYQIRQVVNNLPGGSVHIQVLMYFNNTSTDTVTAVAPQFILQEIAKPSMIDVTTSIMPSKDYRGSHVGGSDGTSGSFTAVDIGTADIYRVVVVAVGWYNSNNSPTLTVGGVSANRVAFVSDGFGQGMCQALFALRYPTGTTADIVVSIGGSPQDINISVWKVVAASAMPISVKTNTMFGDVSSTLYFENINTFTGNVLLAAVYGALSSSNYNASWAGADTPSERADAATGTTLNRRYGAYDMALTESVTHTFQITQSGTVMPLVGVVGLWQ